MGWRGIVFDIPVRAVALVAPRAMAALLMLLLQLARPGGARPPGASGPASTQPAMTCAASEA
eukprot:7737625-Pyramimonas_sp.AAC.1